MGNYGMVSLGEEKGTEGQVVQREEIEGTKGKEMKWK
jgi:hypothetical protein